VSEVRCPNIINFAILQATQKEISNEIEKHLKRWSAGYDFKTPIANDWEAFFENDGNLYDVFRTKIFLFDSTQGATIYVCNSADGWHSLIWNVAKGLKLGGAYFRTTTRPVEWGVHEMEIWENGEPVRHLRTLQDDRGWEFLNRGGPRHFEVTSDFKKRKIRARFNFERLKSYSQEMGVCFDSAYSFPGLGTLVSRIGP
jgi:hypothetical protein